MTRGDIDHALEALVSALDTPALVFGRPLTQLAASPEGRRALEALRSDAGDPWTLGDVSLDALLHRVLEGGETEVVERLQPADGGAPVELRATALAPEAARLALLTLRDPVDPSSGCREHRHALIARLIPGIAHEVRGPLTTISGVAQILALGSGVSGEIADCLRLVEGQVERADALLKSLVAFARGPRDARDLPLSLNDAVTRAHTLLAHELRAGRVRFELDLSPELPLVDADPEDLLLLVASLLVTAVAAARRRGDATPVRVHSHVPGDRLACLDVEVEGCELAPSDVPEPARRIARALGGELGVHPGTGVLVLGLPGYDERLMDALVHAGTEPPRRVLVAHPDLDRGVALVREVAPIGLPVTLVRSDTAARRRLGHGTRLACLVDAAIARSLRSELLPPCAAVALVTGGGADPTPARDVAAERGLEWAPEATAPHRLAELLARASGGAAADGRARNGVAPAPPRLMR